MPDLSLLIPTFNRPAKLYRQLYYLNSLFCHSQFDSILDSVEFIIADGSAVHPSNDFGELFTNILDESKLKLGLQYYYFPHTSLFSRIQWMFDNTDSKYVMLLGEEDLLLPDYLLEAIEFLDLNENFSTWSGRLVNAISYPFFSSLGSIRLDERPFAGFNLDHPSVVSRLTAYFALNAVGTNALAYSIQRRSVFSVYLDYLAKWSDSLFYGGVELLHQVVSLSEGCVSISDRPLIIRDFMYENYVLEAKREAPCADPYPYYGEVSVRLSASHIESKSHLGSSDSLGLIASFIYLSNSLACSRSITRASLDSKYQCQEILAPQMSELSCQAFKASYLNYFWRFKSFKDKIILVLRPLLFIAACKKLFSLLPLE